MSDDGYINLRIVWNVVHGHGPVFNVGERVEVGTSPLWIAVLAVLRLPLWFADPAWLAVLAGIGLSLVGLALAIAGARRWWASLGRPAVLPAGALALVALPPMWDFASSGLETGLSFAWLGACWWALAGRLDDEPRRAPHDPWWLPVLIGLAPLVRPDLLVFGLAFGAALAATSTLDVRRGARALGLGVALPGAYQVFRMGYYGLLVPNTALAKEAGRNLWGRGRIYLDTYLGATWLQRTVVLLAAAFGLLVWRAGATARHHVVAAAPVVAGAVHAWYVTRVGGDFMYARMLLPATFALLCPVAALPLPSRERGRWTAWAAWAPLTGLAVVLVVVGGWRRVEIDNPYLMLLVDDERAAWVTAADGPTHPVSLEDYGATAFVQAAATLPAGPGLHDPTDLRSAPARERLFAISAVGMASTRRYDVHVVDLMSLADPVGAHLEAGVPIRAGHEKPLPWDWALGRYGSGRLPPKAEAARQALRCGDLAELGDAVDEPLTPGRFVRNLVGSVHRTSLRIPVDPRTAREEFC
jgi:arabinofuranosyltransferase